MGQMDTREALEKILAGNKTGVGYFVRHCKNIALVYLKSKVASGNYYLNEVNDSLEDLAWDCIADLFERDEQGNFVELETYFNDIDAQALSEEELKIKTRRLVFSKVNDGLFRIFGNYDSSLSKIIRNLKNAASQLDLLVRRIDTTNHVVFQADPADSKPLMPQEFIEIKLCHRLSAKMNMVEVMKEIKIIFNNQELYRNTYPLVELARIIRRTYVNSHGKIKSQVLPKKPILLNGELQQFLEEAIDRYHEQFYQTYVNKEKISEDELDAYIHAIRNILRHKYITESKLGDGYFDNLKQHMPELTKSNYRDNHRQYLEYMVKLVRRDMIRRIKKVV
nr:hypothetical protein 4 [Balneolaceae bacterium]